MRFLVFALLFSPALVVANEDVFSLSQCIEEFQSPHNPDVKNLCQKMQWKSSCKSVNNRQIPHYDKPGVALKPRRILVLGQIHGDEPDAGVLSFRWLRRLDRLNPQNTWRVVPRLNPDGHRLKSRANARNVDLNRNFPTKDWEELALKEWETKLKKNPRRYPGPSGGSEPETQCAILHIEDFKPEIIVSIHTPYGLIDFDGPKIAFPPFKALPWIMLGNFPGSLGRYMWVERQVPVITIELSTSSLRTSASEFDRFQDFVSNVLDKAEEQISKKN